jgi:murein DD-endopeptidase
VRTRVGLIEALGVTPVGATWREAKLAIFGDGVTPKSRFGLSSLRQFQPRFSIPLWRGEKPMGRLVPLTNLYNYLQPPPELGWSVRVTNVRDFRGGRNTYDSHNGTDLAIPPGTVVVAAAAARVLRVSSEYHRGGRKVVLDHGRGLVTTYNHLSRPLVEPGQVVGRGAPIALSGYSGLDALVGFPWTPPHVHMNVWLNGAYVDPFTAAPDGVSLWRRHNDPVPCTLPASDEAPEPTAWNDQALPLALAACRHEEARRDITSQPTLDQQMGALMMQLNYFPTRFDQAALGGGFSLYRETFPREPRLDLPFSADDYDGVHFPDR